MDGELLQVTFSFHWFLRKKMWGFHVEMLSLYTCITHLLNVWAIFYFRHILAILHFNENLKRQPQRTKDGRTYYRVTYPKYKLGEEVVKHVPSLPTYSKYNQIYTTGNCHHFFLSWKLVHKTINLVWFKSMFCTFCRLCQWHQACDVGNIKGRTTKHTWKVHRPGSRTSLQPVHREAV